MSKIDNSSDPFEVLNSSYIDEIFGRDNDNDMEDIVVRQQREYEHDKIKELQNVQRDERGRLLEGSKIASKSCCDPDRIWQLHYSGFSVKEIVRQLKCSKSTVYRVLKHKPEDKWLNIGDNLPFNK